ncbi:MAG TPA: selenium-dependent molybdenum cofactor biosynthesis protein YqeB [Streptosporangiaceae bacterium]|nr:selenium-dependent molybdenum cofactor biosynthesis protein YqeB [Streptosporangiaceae bacterium]
MSAHGNDVLLPELLAAIEAREPVALATVVETKRSAPRHAGSKMLVWADGRYSGSVGGGEMEARVIAEARLALADGRTRLLHYELLDPGRGDPGVCGGEVAVYLEPCVPDPTVLVVGCGHVGREVASLAHWLGLRVVATDDRPEMVTRDRLPDADILIAGPVADAIGAVRADQTHAVVVTRSMLVDLDVVPQLLAAGMRSVGVIGSSRRWQTTRARLLARGVPACDLDRVRNPIGLELAAETPREIALSILAEVVALHRGTDSARWSPGQRGPAGSADTLVLLRGGGDLATGAAWRLTRAGFPVVVCELEHPLTVRRRVALSSAVADGRVDVEGMVGVRATVSEAIGLARQGLVPVVVSPGLPDLPAQVVVDARMAKRTLDTTIDDAPLVVALGPGHTAGVDAHAVVETMRGPRLGRVLWSGSAAPDTGTPGEVSGHGAERVLRAPAEGAAHWQACIGDLVEAGAVLGTVGGREVRSPFAGVVRGLVADGTIVPGGLKVGDVDPRADTDCQEISDKALAVGGGVLEAVLTWRQGLVTGTPQAPSAAAARPDTVSEADDDGFVVTR